ncbi:MAG: 4Fe-4S binding protein [Gammaproteobacteria bacterium]
MTAKALEAARRAIADYRPQPTSLVGYRSGGRLLILGGAGGIGEILSRLRTLEVFFLPSEGDGAAAVDGATVLPGAAEKCRLTGYLGNFSIDRSPLAFDLVLDLQEKPLIDLEVPPVGYYAPGQRPGGLEAVLAELPGMTGEFDKPKFFEFDAGKCVHSRRELPGCRACLDACPAQAIESVDFKIAINPYLCQGCGDCATVCPTGAVNYRYPGRSDTLNRIRALLKAFSAAGGSGAVLLLHDLEEEKGVIPEAEGVVPYPLESLGSAGIEVWLSALAYGAARVWLYDTGRLTGATRRTLTEQLKIAGALLEDLGYSGDAVRLLPAGAPFPAAENGIAVEPAAFSGVDDKRTATFLALEHLYRFAPRKNAFAPLPEGSPFGRIRVDAAGCTLCMACVSVCPAAALQPGVEAPALKFIESNCVQCGLCRSACPEKVIALEPRYLYDRAGARSAELLHREEAFLCVRCGKPFATRSMIEKIREKLRGHPMLQGDKAGFLSLCEDCRIKSQFGRG